MNCLPLYSDVTDLKTGRRLIPIYIILLIFLSSTYAQNPQWRVFTTANSPLPGNNISSIVIDSNNIKWIGTDSGAVKIEGNNWTIFDTSNIPLGVNWVRPLAFDKFNNIWFSYGLSNSTVEGAAVFNGINWVLYNTTNSGLPSNRVTRIYVDSMNNKWICTFASSSYNGGLAKFNGAIWVVYDTSNSGIPSNFITGIDIKNNIKWISTFGGGVAKYDDTNWVVFGYGSGLPVGYINSIIIDDFAIPWVTTYGGGIAKYNNLTNNWIVYDPNNSGISSAFCDPIVIKNNIKWIGCFYDGGLNRFDDTTWTVFKTYNSGIPSNDINNLCFDKFGNMWIGTYNGLAIYNPNGIIGVEKNSSNIPETFQLYQNYPNPFNNTTNIKFEIPRLTKVNLEVYDINGRLINVLKNSVLSAGFYTVKFDGTNLSSGIYFYKLETNKYQETKKMVLIK